MYNGYLVIGGVQVINNHRVAAYAHTAGLPWVQPCVQCESIAAGRGEHYVSPMLDDPHPPWWGTGADEDAVNFLGFMGIDFANVDDSVREVEVTSSVGDGAYLGSLRYGPRTITVSAVAVATDDCSLGFGLNWLRHVDTVNDCDSTTIDLFECCPHLAASDCDDPVCAKECMNKRARRFYNARITSGPTVLGRRTLSTRGAMAQVEFVITCGDPYIYAPPSTVPIENRASVEVVDPPAETTQRVVSDGFSQTLPYPRPPSLVREPRFLPRDHWLRDVVILPQPDFGVEVVPSVTLWAQAGVPDVRLTLIGPEGPAGVWRMTDFPADGVLTMDFGTRRVTTESNGITRRNTGFVQDGQGGPMRWPRRLPTGLYELWIDRSPGTAPLIVDADVAGRVSA